MSIVHIVEFIILILMGGMMLSLVAKMGKAQYAEDDRESVKATWRQFWIMIGVFFVFIIGFELGVFAQFFEELMRNKNG